jgi:SAM-dependent methyltransferase
MKRRLWNREFANGRWNFIENTSGDLIYGYIEKYCRGGSILDLGCGSGNTDCELDGDRYGTCWDIYASWFEPTVARQ